MIRLPLLALLLAAPVPLAAQAIQPGGWSDTVKVTELTVPGMPAFLLRMVQGKSKTTHKCISAQQAAAGAAALIAPDAKAKCTVEHEQVGGGRFEQRLICQQKKGGPLRISRVGTYTATSLTARMTVDGQTPKGAMHMAGDQVAVRTGAACAR